MLAFVWQVSVATPSLGPVRGGSRVTVLGAGFRDAYTLRCRFSSEQDVSITTPARYIEASQIECSSPEHSVGIAMV